MISIHALLAESDLIKRPFGLFDLDFNPRSPCGERLPGIYVPDPRGVISIHALLAESDLRSLRPTGFANHFNPRSPCGERLGSGVPSQCHPQISIHALLAESDRLSGDAGKGIHHNFNPRSPCGERPMPRARPQRQSRHFNPRSPCGERPDMAVRSIPAKGISIHALLAESDRRFPR